jgi:hypothetical protein
MSPRLHPLSTNILRFLWRCVPISWFRISSTPFSGGHDNGYTSALTSLENEGFLNKVVLLRGYKDVALELKNLRLPELTIDGVFMTRKLQTNVFQRNGNYFPESLPSVSAPASPKKSSTHTTSTFGDEPRYLEPGVVSLSTTRLRGLIVFLSPQPLHKRIVDSLPVRSTLV